MKIREPKIYEYNMVSNLYFYEQCLFYGVNEKDPGFQRDVRAFPEWVRTHACEAFVTDDGHGFCALTPNKDGSKYVYAIWVDKEYRGKGYGEALLKHAKELSPEGLALHCNVLNPSALCLYHKCGFRFSMLEGWYCGGWSRAYMETRPGLLGKECDTEEFAFPPMETTT